MFLDMNNVAVAHRDVARLMGGTRGVKRHRIGGGYDCYLTPHNVRISAYYKGYELDRFRFWISANDFSVDFISSEILAENFVKIRSDGFVSLRELRMQYNEIAKIARDLKSEKVVVLRKKRDIREEAEKLTKEIGIERFRVNRDSMCWLSGNLTIEDFEVSFTCYIKSDSVTDVMQMLFANTPFIFSGKYSTFELKTYSDPDIQCIDFRFYTPDVSLIRRLATVVACFPVIRDKDRLRAANFYF